MDFPTFMDGDRENRIVEAILKVIKPVTGLIVEEREE
jgi:hypothetical protein